MVSLAVELGQLGLEVRADRGKNAVQRGQLRGGEHVAPPFQSDHQMRMQQVDAVTSTALIGGRPGPGTNI